MGLHPLLYDDSVNILSIWHRLSKFGWLGRWFFSRLIGRMAPYSGSIGATVKTLEMGKATVLMRDRRRLGNPFGSLHAIAIANLGELASGLAFLTMIPPGKRGIVTMFRIEYFKKARGNILAVSNTVFPDKDGPFEVEAVLSDEKNERVARTVATWKVGPTA